MRWVRTRSPRAREFLEGFAPAAYEGGGEDHLRLAFVTDGFGGRDERVAGVYVRSEGEKVVGEVFGEADVGAVRAQVARILSLDVDGRGFAEVGERDPVVGRLQARYLGLRPVCFYSPYEAAAWALIGHRVRIVQAVGIKARMAKELGPVRGGSRRAGACFPGAVAPDAARRLPGALRAQGRELTLTRVGDREGEAGHRSSALVIRRGGVEEVKGVARHRRITCRHANPGSGGPSPWLTVSTVRRVRRSWRS